MTDFKPGQRWISNAEPELGIGQILKTDERVITIGFERTNEVRTYATRQAPLTRVRFQAGDRIHTADGIEFEVSRVSERDGIFIYQGQYQGTDTAIIETDLDANITFSKPEERLFTHQIDDNRWFNLRYRTLAQRASLSASTEKGLLGPRVSLIPHQFYIAQDVAGRHAPRVLLADEVGLGKTIEAGLIIHQQLMTGKASRILIVVPPALTFQWFVEMIRRFNLQFTILDEERCLDIEADNSRVDESDAPELDNPFEAQQLVLCSLDLFLSNEARIRQATETEWDLLVVDEAHHLSWVDNVPGPDYQVIEQLSAITRGLLLLTATPEQLGMPGHFSRLRLLDPSRYHDYSEFLEEEKDYEAVADLVSRLQAEDPAAANAARERLGAHAPERDDELIPALLDRHGTGRVLFRNVRESVAGFPRRELHAYELAREGFPTESSTTWQSNDARVNWLVNLLTESREKFLVICRRAETAIALEKHLRDRTTIRSVAFHEGLDLVARDRAASYFSDTEKGAQVLVCSEIGSEGRNFQFAHHLVMYDLPGNPDLLEQRIGRLDRIGQREDVHIHVPFAKDTEQGYLLRLFDEGFSIFEKPNAAAQFVFENLPADVDDSHLLELARRESEQRLALLRSGRDRLLELNSHRQSVSAELLSRISTVEVDAGLENYMELSFDLFGLESDVLSEGIFTVKPTESMVRNSAVSVETGDRFRYPELPEEGTSYTFNREIALNREDLLFLTWEHPLVEQAMDLVASDVTGNCAVVVTKTPGIRAGTLLVETLHIIECVAPRALNADQHLPPALVRTLLTPDQQDISNTVPFRDWSDSLEVPADTINKIVAQQEDGIKQLISSANQFAREKFQPIRDRALESMEQLLGIEQNRLRALAEFNPNIRQDEIDYLENSRNALHAAIETSQIRLEAVRLIIAA